MYLLMLPVLVHQFSSQQSLAFFLLKNPPPFLQVLWQVPKVIEHDGGNLLVGRRRWPRWFLAQVFWTVRLVLLERLRRSLRSLVWSPRSCVLLAW